MEMQEVIIYLVVFAAFGGYYIFRYLKKEKQETPVQEKIKAYRNAGHALVHEQDVPLTDQEAAKIRTTQDRMTFGLMLMIIAILTGVACLLIFVVEINTYLALTGFVILSGAWIYYSLRERLKMRSKIKGGSKTIIRGIITKKYEDNDSDETTSYYFVVDKVEVNVKKAVYKQYQLGDAVEIHVFKPYYWYVLYQTRLEGAGLNDVK
jgi:hypothetical protein